MQEKTSFLTVSSLNSKIKNVLEGDFQNIMVRGEISNFHLHPSSGHMYFTLKDAKSEIKCVMFKGNNLNLKFKPGNGMKVHLSGSLTIYEQRGQIQLRIIDMSLEGDGDLFLAYELLKKNLFKEGLFEVSNKKIIPKYPRIIGIVTSITSAAFQDILNIIQRRAPHLEIIVRSVIVQGDHGSKNIISGIKDFNKYGIVDTIILARGGGSLEDLWCFNEESVARAIYKSKIPIISGVGHETDFTIADFVSDLRAPTPSAAAELVSPDKESILTLFHQIKHQLKSSVLKKIEGYLIRLDYIENRANLQQPGKKIKIQLDKITEIQKNLIMFTKNKIIKKKQEISSITRQLLNLSPENVLKRGYSIVFKEDGKTILSNSEDVALNETFKVKMAKGLIIAKKSGEYKNK